MTTTEYDKNIFVEDECDKKIDKVLRPQQLNSFIGQKDFIEKIKITMQATKERNDVFPNSIFSSGPGLGKSSLAYVIANELGKECQFFNAAALKTPSDLIKTFSQIEFGDVLFLDECAALSKLIQTNLLTILEDYKVNIRLADKQLVTLNIKPFTLLAATNDIGKLSRAFIERFDIVYTMQSYTDNELFVIIDANIKKLGIKCDSEAAIMSIAARSRGIPRVSNRILRRVIDWCQVKNNNVIDLESVNKALLLENIDECGLTENDRLYLKTIYHKFGNSPVGKIGLALSLGESQDTIETVIEPFLIKLGFIIRSSRGRMLTAEGIRYIRGK